MAMDSATSRIEPKQPLTDRDKAGVYRAGRGHGRQIRVSVVRFRPGHHQLMAGVNDSDFRAKSRQRLLQKGLPPSTLIDYFPT